MDGKNYEYQQFSDIRLEEEVLRNCEFMECEFTNCTVDTCTLVNCTFSGCIFTNCTVISPQVKDSRMKNSEFENCSLVGVHWQELNVKGGIAGPFQSFRNCLMKYNSFVELNLKAFDFTGNMIQNSSFEDCKLAESNFHGCRLEETDFNGNDMQKADFREARGYRIDIAGNKMKAAEFSYPEVLSLLAVLGIKIED